MSNKILEGMDKNYEAYNIDSEDGERFLLILKSDNKDIVCVLDDHNDLGFGLVDNN